MFKCIHKSTAASIFEIRNILWEKKWQIPPYLQLAFAPLSSKNLTICWCPALVQWNKAVQPWMSFISSSAPCFKRTEKVLYCTPSAGSLSHCPSALWYQESLNPCQGAELTTEHKSHTLVATRGEFKPCSVALPTSYGIHTCRRK